MRATTFAFAFAATLASPVGVPAQQSPRGIVRIDTVWSQSLGARKSLRLYLPPSYATNAAKRYPVLFYLHGLTGSEKDWTDAGHIHTTMDSLIAAGQPEAIIAMPDGDDGWWTTANMFADTPACRADSTRKEPADSFCVPWLHYDDYVARDLVSYVDRTYRTVANRASRAIGGLSMGGYGAITLALAYPTVFSAAASHSGVVSPRFTGPKPYAEPPSYARDTIALRNAVGWLWKSERVAFGLDTMGWVARDPARLATVALARQKKGGPRLPAIFMDCGRDDAYVDQNRALNATLTKFGVSHRYAEWPGNHNWEYWRSHVAESLMFLLSQTRGAATK